LRGPQCLAYPLYLLCALYALYNGEMIYIASFLVLLVVVAAMAVGVIFRGRPIRGSCGGLNCPSCADRPRCQARKESA